MSIRDSTLAGSETHDISLTNGTNSLITAISDRLSRHLSRVGGRTCASSDWRVKLWSGA
jgi:hypothetical protein